MQQQGLPPCAPSHFFHLLLSCWSLPDLLALLALVRSDSANSCVHGFVQGGDDDDMQQGCAFNVLKDGQVQGSGEERSEWDEPPSPAREDDDNNSDKIELEAMAVKTNQDSRCSMEQQPM
eukprot:766293-Hanusia_phi.AAC.5